MAPLIVRVFMGRASTQVWGGIGPRSVAIFEDGTGWIDLDGSTRALAREGPSADGLAPGLAWPSFQDPPAFATVDGWRVTAWHAERPR